MYSLDNYITQVNIKVDESNKYGQFEKKIFAEIACDIDTECIGIYDASCDQEGPFMLVKKGFMISNWSPDCINKKKTYHGRNEFSCRQANHDKL